MINPGQIPQYTGNLGQLETATGGLKTDAGDIRTTGAHVHTHFQGLAAYYQAPDAEQLFATTKPVQDRADTFATHLETVSTALSDYATEIRPLVAKLAQLKTDATTFVNENSGDDDWQYDGDKVAQHNQLRDDITTTVAAFWAAERTCHNKITATFGGTQMVAGDGSKRPNQYGFNAADMKGAKLPWGDPVDEKHHWYEIGHWIKSFVWDGLVIDGVWGTIKGLGTLVGVDGWSAMGQAWKGLAQLATGLTITQIPGVGAAFWTLPDKKLPSWLRDSRKAMKQTGKALVAWDEWGKNPARAAGAVTFNVLTAIATDGAGSAASGAGKAGAVAKVLSAAGKAGRVIDPMTYITKGAGAGLSKIGDITKGLRGVGTIDIPHLPDGSVKLPDGRTLAPNGDLIGPNGVIDTTPIPHDPGLPAHQHVPQPAHAGVRAGDGLPRDVGRAGDSLPPGGHHDPSLPGGSTKDHVPGGTPHPPGSTPHTPAGSFDHTPASYDHTPTATPHGAPHGGTHVPSAPHDGGHVPSTPHQGGHAPSTPHGGGHDTPTGHGHDTPAGHGHDGSHGAGQTHGSPHAGGHMGAGDHSGLGDTAAHHGTDAPAAPGHSGTDVPGHSGPGEPFEYKPVMSRHDFANLPTDAAKHAAAAAELERGTNPAASLSDDAGQAYGDAYWNHFLDNMDSPGREALSTYSGHEYTEINGALRGTHNVVSPKIAQTIHDMDRVLGARPVPDDIMVVRGTGIDHLNLESPLDMEGDVFGDQAYTSTALGKTVPPAFSYKPVVMHLRVPKGTPALWLDHISQNPGERELLLGRGTQYKVTRVFMDQSGKWQVYGEVLPKIP